MYEWTKMVGVEDEKNKINIAHKRMSSHLYAEQKKTMSRSTNRHVCSGNMEFCFSYFAKYITTVYNWKYHLETRPAHYIPLMNKTHETD